MDGAQQFGLQFGWQFADFVEKQGAAVGERERAVAGGDRAGEGAAFVAEELAACEGGDDRGAVDDDEVAFVGARVEGVDELGGEFFAGAAFAGDEDVEGR